MPKHDFLLQDIKNLKGIGIKTANLLKKKKIHTILDILFKLPRSKIDGSELKKVSELQIGKITTLLIKVEKYSFPRIKNLPKKVVCSDDTGIIDCVFFNSYEGYIRKILPIGKEVTISGKIKLYNKRYQIVNPVYISENTELIKKKYNQYSLTEGISQKAYDKIISQVLRLLPDLDEWLPKNIHKHFDNLSWQSCVRKLHESEDTNNYLKNYYRRLAFDEILATLLVSSEKRIKIKKKKTEEKKFKMLISESTKKRLNFNLTKDQKNAINAINEDLKSPRKMFRLLQGDVGSGKTIVALLTALNVIESGFQVAFMAPTEILSNQHFNFAKKIFPPSIKCSIITGKSTYADKKRITNDLSKNKINIVFGTHALFQKKINFNKLGFIIIDEQHKFGVNQRKKLSDKGGVNCDVLLMSATPIPRTLTMTIYGDMDLSIIREKPKNRKEITTYSKPENKINDVINFVKKEISKGNQVFWVCPLIDDSTKIDHTSTKKRYESLKNIFKKRLKILHGNIDIKEKEEILNDFINKKFDILISTTVIEVGIDFPNADLIIIENANKFGLSQLHQLRGRVGRGNANANCILMFKSNLSQNAVKRINIFKKSNDGFFISEEDMKLRGYGDILGFKQSGLKNFILADPLQNKDLFKLAENEINNLIHQDNNFEKYNTLMKLYDRAEVINDLV